MTHTIPPHGYVRLIDTMGSDQSIEAAARVSYGDNRNTSDTRRLLRYLMRNRHTSPFEMAELIFEIKCPIFVARQIFRHRTASYNEVSGRYTDLSDVDIWYPYGDYFRAQGTENKQGSLDARLGNVDEWGAVGYETKDLYDSYIDQGVCREQARGILPLATYTTFIMKIDLHNLLHFLQLRLDHHAQQECRDVAEAMATYVKDHFPITWEAFEDYRLNAVTFSAQEIEMIQQWIQPQLPTTTPPSMSEGEYRDFKKKLGESTRWLSLQDVPDSKSS